MHYGGWVGRYSAVQSSAVGGEAAPRNSALDLRRYGEGQYCAVRAGVVECSGQCTWRAGSTMQTECSPHVPPFNMAQTRLQNAKSWNDAPVHAVLSSRSVRHFKFEFERGAPPLIPAFCPRYCQSAAQEFTGSLLAVYLASWTCQRRLALQ